MKRRARRHPSRKKTWQLLLENPLKGSGNKVHKESRGKKKKRERRENAQKTIQCAGLLSRKTAG